MREQRIVRVPDGKVAVMDPHASVPRIRDALCRMDVGPFDQPLDKHEECGKPATVQLVHLDSWIDWWCPEHAEYLLEPAVIRSHARALA